MGRCQVFITATFLLLLVLVQGKEPAGLSAVVPNAGRLGTAAPPVLRDSSADVLLEEDAADESLEGSCIANSCKAISEVAGDFPSTDAGDPFLVPLRREATPVYRGNEIVSFKTSFSGQIALGSGNEMQPFRVVFDTGSGHVVVPSIQCHSETCLAHARYNMSKSSNAKAVNMNGNLVVPGKMRDQVTIGFGTGKVVGRFVEESVCLGAGRYADGGLSGPGPCMDMMVIAAISMTQQPFQSFKFDGIVGLGLRALALSDSFSFFDILSKALVQQRGDADMPGSSRFGVYIAEGTGDPDEEPSEIAFGGYNPKRMLEPLKWAPVAMAEKGYWQVEIFELRIGNTSLNICKDVVCRGIVDTGTSHLGVPGSVFNEVAMGLTVPAGDAESCDQVEADSLHITLDGFVLDLRPEDYMRRLPLAPGVNPGSRMTGDDGAFDEPESPVGADIANGGKTCRPKLMPVNMPAPLGPHLFILGEPLLKRYYTAFDWKELKVGFARSARPEVPDRNDGVTMLQRDIGVMGSEQDDDMMWYGDDNSFMVQMNVAVDQVQDDVAGQVMY